MKCQYRRWFSVSRLGEWGLTLMLMQFMCRSPPNICPWQPSKSHGLQRANSITECISKSLEQKSKWIYRKLPLKLHFLIKDHLTLPITPCSSFFTTYVIFYIGLSPTEVQLPEFRGFILVYLCIGGAQCHVSYMYVFAVNQIHTDAIILAFI